MHALVMVSSECFGCSTHSVELHHELTFIGPNNMCANVWYKLVSIHDQYRFLKVIHALQGVTSQYNTDPTSSVLATLYYLYSPGLH